MNFSEKIISFLKWQHQENAPIYIPQELRANLNDFIQKKLPVDKPEPQKQANKTTQIPVVESFEMKKPASATPSPEVIPENRETQAADIKSVEVEYSLENCKSLEDLQQIVFSCEKCQLAQKRNKIVFGEGDPHADILFIGEGPGRDEDLSGRPFVGKAGQLLTKIIENGLKVPRQSIYICNIVKCRPPGNRDPYDMEAAACISYLKKQIELVQPKVIVLLGKVALRYLMGIDKSMHKSREMELFYQDIPVYPTYHPSALLRNDKFKRPVWEDMKKVIRKLKLYEV